MVAWFPASCLLGSSVPATVERASARVCAHKGCSVHMRMNTEWFYQVTGSLNVLATTVSMTSCSVVTVAFDAKLQKQIVFQKECSFCIKM